MKLKEELLQHFKKNDTLLEAMFRIVDGEGNVIDTLDSQEELDDYNQKYDDKDFQVQEINGKSPLELLKTKKRTRKPKKTPEEVQAEVDAFYANYRLFKQKQDERLAVVEREEPSEYWEMKTKVIPALLRKWWRDNKKYLSVQARKRLAEIKRNRKLKKESFIGNFQYKKLLTESQHKDFTFYKTLLEATFNPNVKSSWITQIWFEPNEDELEETEDEDGNIIPVNPNNPNIKGTVFMRVKNSKSGKVYPTYEFYDVPRKVYIMWRRARSKGKYFWRRMKYNYE